MITGARPISALPIIAGLQPNEWLTLLGIVLGPIFAVVITLWIEGRRRNREQQLTILRLLLTTRHLVGDPNYSSAINLIPLAFAGQKLIQDAFKKYIEAANADVTDSSQQKAVERTLVAQTRLIFSIAKSMRFRIAETDIQTTAYAATGWINRDNLDLDARKAVRDVATQLTLQNRIMGRARLTIEERQFLDLPEESA